MHPGQIFTCLVNKNLAGPVKLLSFQLLNYDCSALLTFPNLGGESSNTMWSDTSEIFNATDGTVKAGPDLPVPLYGPCTVKVDKDTAFMIGGRTSQPIAETLRSVHKINLAASKDLSFYLWLKAKGL